MAVLVAVGQDELPQLLREVQELNEFYAVDIGQVKVRA